MTKAEELQPLTADILHLENGWVELGREDLADLLLSCGDLFLGCGCGRRVAVGCNSGCGQGSQRGGG